MDVIYKNLFSRHGLSLERLRAFLETAEAGGITKAVGPDPVRQSQYSRQIAELQSFFGVELLARRGKVLILTPAGQRLAVLIRESLTGLSDFEQACAGEPIRFHIGAGDSLLQWVVLPQVGRLTNEFPSFDFSLHSHRTSEVIAGLGELRLDFGLVRQDAVRKPLSSSPLGTITFALFIPNEWVKGRKSATFEWALGNLPIATQSSDGQFTRRLYQIAEEKRRSFRLHLGCETFPQALQALLSRQYAAILPQMALAGTDRKSFLEISCPELDTEKRLVELAWNPRLIGVRKEADKLLQRLRKLLQF